LLGSSLGLAELDRVVIVWQLRVEGRELVDLQLHLLALVKVMRSYSRKVEALQRLQEQ
jgi:hypothetical protein